MLLIKFISDALECFHINIDNIIFLFKDLGMLKKIKKCFRYFFLKISLNAWAFSFNMHLIIQFRNMTFLLSEYNYMF